MDQETILVVDDDEDIRDSLQILFEDEGYMVLTAQDGQEALRIIPTLPEPSAILLDLLMPRLDGAGVLQNLAAHPGTRNQHPIFLVTANVRQFSPELAHLLRSQRVPVLPKPFDPDHLLLQVRSALDQTREQRH